MKDYSRLSRRHFFKHAGLGAAGVSGMPLLMQSCTGAEENNRVKEFFADGDVVLFQGDSITDAGRNREQELPNNPWSFGVGYANHIAAWLLAEMPGKDLTIYNRGISGNKVFQLADRWGKDCLDLDPNVLSILIGVNDYWHFRNERYDGTPEVYENDYRDLLTRTMEAIPDLKLIICQPFILTGTSAVDESWVEPFSAYQDIAKSISDEFGAVWVPFQEAFNQAMELAPPAYWAGDGVHPSMAGAQLMASTWLEALG